MFLLSQGGAAHHGGGVRRVSRRRPLAPVSWTTVLITTALRTTVLLSTVLLMTGLLSTVSQTTGLLNTVLVTTVLLTTTLQGGAVHHGGGIRRVSRRGPLAARPPGCLSRPL
jgi:hypothetical protein